MPGKTTSALSMKRIIISCLIFTAIPLAAHLLNIVISQYAISLMFCMNAGTSILIIYDWNLFGIHYNRAKKNAMDTILFTSLGAILIMLWVYVGANILQADLILPGNSDLIAYGYARPGMLIAFSFMEAANISISYKCFTDHFDVHGKELQSILLSSLLFGLLFTVIYMPSLNISLFFRTYLYNMVLIAILAYLYNQCHTFIPGLLAMAVIYFIIMLQSSVI
ncbi:MAG: hypothetical protein LKF53_03800 [Solobacterium sp.]|jgi:hypothetical protein|nr:hypothetical protein [Solobacterium sp.]MCH4205497.1 hypothetical protein [Solobacterium sp.]MCH4227021.1 hypothetical protein [Solobacterium sp.]MCH4282184.1 hypothetical protein [Solobacterium sp.]